MFVIPPDTTPQIPAFKIFPFAESNLVDEPSEVLIGIN